MVAVSSFVTAVAAFVSSTITSAQHPEPCDLSKATFPLSPAQQTALGSPGGPLTAVGVAFGVQNYSCSTNNAFVYVSG